MVRVDVECATWDVLAPSWTQLLVRYAEELELFAADPHSSTLAIDDLGPACEWGGGTPSDSPAVRPAWLLNVDARDPYPYHRAESEATAMQWRDERNEQVDKDADRRRWDHPY